MIGGGGGNNYRFKTRVHIEQQQQQTKQSKTKLLESSKSSVIFWKILIHALRHLIFTITLEGVNVFVTNLQNWRNWDSKKLNNLFCCFSQWVDVKVRSWTLRLRLQHMTASHSLSSASKIFFFTAFSFSFSSPSPPPNQDTLMLLWTQSLCHS